MAARAPLRATHRLCDEDGDSLVLVRPDFDPGREGKFPTCVIQIIETANPDLMEGDVVQCKSARLVELRNAAAGWGNA